MPKLTKALLVLIVGVIIATAGIALGVNYYMVHQNLTVPASPGMSLFRNDGVTPISNGEEITSLWSWTGTQFTVGIVIRNTGNIILNTSLNTTFVPVGWSVTIVGNGSLPIGGSQTVNLVAIPPNLIGGTTTGDFDLWFIG
jgi:hypothetical protein